MKTWDEVESAFENPPAQYRAKAFWSWNGLLEKERLLQQMEVIAQMGFGGFFMHSRTGLATPYLGEEWFELINCCTDRAQALGLEAWIYDEDRWPSGTAGGKVTEDPALRMSFLRLRLVEGAAFQWPETALAAFSCTLNGMACYDCQRIYPETPRQEYAEKTVLLFSIEAMACEDQYNGFCYLDTMQRAATERFIALTHEAYHRQCGDRLGTTIRGIFTDEPHRGSLMDGFSLHNSDAAWLAPHTPALFETYREAFGEDLLEQLPELFLHPEGRTLSPVKWRYVEILQRLFIENWAKPLDAWCREHDLILTGHLLHEDSLAAQTAMCGSLMRCYPYLEYPGVDVLTEGNKKFWIVKQLSSAARQSGQRWLLSELYGATGWQISFAGYKYAGDWQALFGVNVRCPHLSWYTMAGESKRDHPASILHQSAWWPHYHRLETYFARLGLLLSQGERRCSLLVLHPVESLWAQVYPGWSKDLVAQSEAMQELENTFMHILHTLCGAGIDFDYGDEGMLAEMAGVEPGPLFRVGQARYSAVLVGGLSTIRSSTLRLLEAFREAGGAVIFLGAPPTHLDAAPTDRVHAFAQGCEQHPMESKAWLQCCRQHCPVDLHCLDAPTGAPLEAIYSQVRDFGERRIIFAMNVDRDRAYRDVRVRLRASGTLTQWECVSGDQQYQHLEQVGEWSEFEIDFPPGGSFCWILEPELCTTAGPPFPLSAKEEFFLDSPCAYSLEEANVCVLDRAQWRLDAGSSQEEMEILKIDQALRKRFKLSLRGGEMKQPWFQDQEKNTVYTKLRLRFSFTIEDLPKGELRLAMEDRTQFSISLNGSPLPDQPRKEFWVDDCFEQFPIPRQALQEGENEILLSCDWREDIGLEALYLLGNFGVKIFHTQCTLTSAPQELRFRDLVNQGLPFYSGAVTYHLNLPRSPEAGERVFLAIPQFEAACIAVRHPATKQVVAFLGWPAYEAEISDLARESDSVDLEIILTRRNTFGPLHQVPLDYPGCGPTSFVTTEENFAEGYMLYPAGFLSPIQILYRS